MLKSTIFRIYIQQNVLSIYTLISSYYSLDKPVLETYNSEVEKVTSGCGSGGRALL